jgi:hypothetical protein
VEGKPVPTRKEIEDQIAALQAEAEAMGDGEDYEIEIWNEKGAGTRLPSRAGEGFLREHFPELFKVEEEGTEEEGTETKGKPAKPAGKTTPARATTAGKYFGKRPAGK